MYSSVINLTSNSADASAKASYPTTLRQQNCLSSWSGGKDSYYALQLAVQQGYTPKVLLNVLNEQGQISRSHGIPLEILTAQAAAMQVPLHTIASSWNDYETNFITAL
ncbi:MAG TPA: ATPase, partial [Chitinophagaceae bacterium]|nr:ATPase [Chitinophagaceae bacterium]